MAKTYPIKTIERALDWFSKLDLATKSTIMSTKTEDIVEFYLECTKDEKDNEMIFNINEAVKVKLTEYGKSVWEKYFNDNRYPKQNYTFEEHYNQYTKEGYTEMQLHQLFLIFGEQTYMGNQNCFDKNEIIFNKQDFKK